MKDEITTFLDELSVLSNKYNVIIDRETTILVEIGGGKFLGKIMYDFENKKYKII